MFFQILLCSVFKITNYIDNVSTFHIINVCFCSINYTLLNTLSITRKINKIKLVYLIKSSF